MRNSNCLKVFFLYVNDETFLFAIFPVNHQRPFTFSPLVQTILFFILLFNIHISSDDTRSEREENDAIATLLEKKIISSHGMSDNNQNNPCSDINIDKIAIQASSVGNIVWVTAFIYLCVWNRRTAFYKRTYGQSL